MKRFFFTLLLGLLFSGLAFAESANGADKAGRSLFDAWNATQNTAIELHINFETLEANRKTNNEIPAVVIQDGKSLELDVTVRGRFRRRTCTMPPMKLQFKKDGLRALGLNTHNDFKLVTHCTDDKAGQDALIREQLAYELYNTVNPAASFRTQLLTITYVNTADGSTTTSYAILIEDFDELKNRLAAESCHECYQTPASKIVNAETLALFQYMIGNNDYDTAITRNMKLVTSADGTKTFIPYDFDYSGLVNASYATGAPHFGTSDVTDRVLLWKYASEADFSEAISYMVSLKSTFFAQVENNELLSNGSKREITKYLKGFYRDLEKQNFTLAK